MSRNLFQFILMAPWTVIDDFGAKCAYRQIVETNYQGTQKKKKDWQTHKKNDSD